MSELILLGVFFYRFGQIINCGAIRIWGGFKNWGFELDPLLIPKKEHNPVQASTSRGSGPCSSGEPIYLQFYPGYLNKSSCLLYQFLVELFEIIIYRIPIYAKLGYI